MKIKYFWNLSHKPNLPPVALKLLDILSKKKQGSYPNLLATHRKNVNENEIMRKEKHFKILYILSSYECCVNSISQSDCLTIMYTYTYTIIYIYICEWSQYNSWVPLYIQFKIQVETFKVFFWTTTIFISFVCVCVCLLLLIFSISLSLSSLTGSSSFAHFMFRLFCYAML